MTDYYNWLSGAIRDNSIIYINAVNKQHFCMTAWMLLYLGNEMCHIRYTYEKRSGMLTG